MIVKDNIAHAKAKMKMTCSIESSVELHLKGHGFRIIALTRLDVHQWLNIV